MRAIRQTFVNLTTIIFVLCDSFQKNAMCILEAICVPFREGVHCVYQLPVIVSCNDQYINPGASIKAKLQGFCFTMSFQVVGCTSNLYTSVAAVTIFFIV